MFFGTPYPRCPLLVPKKSFSLIKIKARTPTPFHVHRFNKVLRDFIMAIHATPSVLSWFLKALLLQS